MNELFPVVCGMLVGVSCGGIRSTRWRTRVWMALSVLCGAAATLLSGEYKLGWEYLLMDVPLAVGAAWGAMTLSKHRRVRSPANE